MSKNNNWYHTKQEIEENSPSKIDGIDTKQETFQRWSYTTFLQELGQRLKNPQKTIATSTILCQRFFTRQSLAKNDSKTISIICMFIAGKAEDSPRPVNDVINVAYKLLHDKEPSKQVYEVMKDSVLTGEKLVLATLGFDFDIEHSYRLLFDWVRRSIKEEKDAKCLFQAALNFVNDSLRTSLCLQYKTSQIAAGAIYLGSRFVDVKLPWDGEKVWWIEFDVTKRQLFDITNQVLDLYGEDFLVPVTRFDRKQNKAHVETKYCV
ncbi:unnamed protein product [Cochlearia groenlandica]